MIYVDIGTCKGEEAQLAYHLGYEVHAFEPHPENAKYLRSNFDFIVNEAAAWNSDGTARLYLHKNGNYDGASLVKEKSNTGDMWLEVKTINIREYLHALGEIELLKIDAEGAEYIILESVYGLPIKKICVEDHERKIQDHRWKERKARVLDLYKDTVIHKWI